MQRLHRLLDRRIRVEAMDLQKIDVRRVKAAQTGLDLVEDGAARESTLVDIVTRVLELWVEVRLDREVLRDKAEALGKDEDLVPRDVVLLEELADDAFGLAVRVNVRSVDSVHAAIPGGFEQRDRLVLVDDPGLREC